MHNMLSQYNCSSSKKSVHCLEYVYDVNTYSDLVSGIEGIDAVLNEVEEYKSKTFNEKEISIINTITDIQLHINDDMHLYLNAIKLDEYMALIDCGESADYAMCVYNISEYEQKALNVIENAIYNNVHSYKSIEDYLGVFAGNRTTRYIAAQLLIKTLSFSNACSYMNEYTSKQTLSLITSLLKETKGIFTLIHSLYHNESNYLFIINDMISLYVKSISSVQKVISYMDVSDVISISGNAKYNYIIEDTVLTAYTNVLTNALTNMFVFNNISSYNNNNNSVLFKYIECKNNSNVSEFKLNEVVSVRVVDFDKAEKVGVKGLGFAVYKEYPLISVVKESEMFGDVFVGVDVVLQGEGNGERGVALWEKVEVEFNRSILGVNVTKCYVVKDGKVTKDDVSEVVNEERNVLSCFVGCVGDVIVSTRDIREDEEEGMCLEWWSGWGGCWVLGGVCV